MAEGCVACGRAFGTRRLLLVRGKVQESYCSESCVLKTVHKRWVARTATRLRALLASALVGLLLAGGSLILQRHRPSQPEVISSGAGGAPAEPAPPEPITYGPPWPPTDAEWIDAFSDASWTYPLPGPVRRVCTTDGRIFGPEPSPQHPAPRCRQPGHCGVDLGGELWGEHVYAVLDGVVEHVQGGGADERGGLYVRLSHFGGMVFTQYFHLAAIPRGVSRGARIKAGDTIGLLGDTGVRGTRRHLHFTLSVRPSLDFSEVYWDPEPWMAGWLLRQPIHGTVAGYAPPTKERENSRRRRWR